MSHIINSTDYSNYQITSQFHEYDDFLNAYISIDRAANDVSWLKADLLTAMLDKLGDGSLRELSKELGENYATLVSYIRVARAFPPNTRSEKAPFSLHFQASFSDKFNSETQNFIGNSRFEWVNKAVDENLSTRSLARAIHEEKDASKEIGERSQATVVAESIRHRIATVVKMADDGNKNSLSLLLKIQELLENYA